MPDNNSKLHEFPMKRIAPVDGMAVTADVWEEAHSYHRARMRLHSLYGHGTGIVAGLEVIASDPPDTSVYIRPGVAIDESGEMIVVTDPVAFEIGHTADGVLYLLLTYGEGRPRAGGDVGEDGVPYYVSSEFSVEAVNVLPQTPHIELARINRRGRTTPILDADDAAHPEGNEIDLRHRREMAPTLPRSASIGVIYVGGDNDERHRRGVNRLAQAISSGGRTRAIVDHYVELDESLEVYTLLYIVGLDSFSLSPGEMNAIYAFLQGGGTVLYESCRHDVAMGDPAADAAFKEMLVSLGISIEALTPMHAVLSEPHVFAAPPVGFENQGAPDIQVADGLIYSAEDYGCLWNGERRNATPSRGEIRDAFEWGENILAYASLRKQTAGQSPTADRIG